MSARERLRDVAGPELVERLDHLDATRGIRQVAPSAPRPVAAHDRFDADVVIVGGGLWSILAPVLAAQGLSVIVAERSRTGMAHREWNASGPELEALKRVGLVDAIDPFVVARYARGTCRFHTGGDYPVYGVLDHAVDAGTLLAHARQRGEQLGVRYYDNTTVTAHVASDHGVRAGDITARVMVDARGASSPYATADLVCPTVGGVMGGLDCDPTVGEILVTNESVAYGRQHIWEAFPGRAGETTVYLFYYARTGEPGRLIDLYDRFFATLPAYKSGDARLLRPTFGYIPGWSRLTPAPVSDHERVVLVGDAAARHSPLTYCGFGAALRSLEPCRDLVQARVEGRAADTRFDDDAPIHGLTGALARLMASRGFEGDRLNKLLDAAFATLAGLGNDVYASLLRDEMSSRDFAQFLQLTARRHRSVWSDVMRGLGPLAAGRWSLKLARNVLHGA